MILLLIPALPKILRKKNRPEKEREFRPVYRYAVLRQRFSIFFNGLGAVAGDTPSMVR